jgi:hypothetical protein
MSTAPRRQGVLAGKFVLSKNSAMDAIPSCRSPDYEHSV